MHLESFDDPSDEENEIPVGKFDQEEFDEDSDQESQRELKPKLDEVQKFEERVSEIQNQEDDLKVE